MKLHSIKIITCIRICNATNQKHIYYFTFDYSSLRWHVLLFVVDCYTYKDSIGNEPRRLVKLVLSEERY